MFITLPQQTDTCYNIPVRNVFCKPELEIFAIIGQNTLYHPTPIPEYWNVQRRLYDFPTR